MTASRFESRWLGLDGIFGGFVLAGIVTEADRVDGFGPQAVTMHFLAAVRPGDVDVAVETLHRGRRTASTRVELRQGERTLAHAIASLVPRGQQVSWTRRVDVAPWGDPASAPPLASPHPQLSFRAHLEARAIGPVSLDGGTWAWVRFSSVPDESARLGPQARAAVLLDALAPGLFAAEPAPVFVPSVEFSAHFSPLLDEIPWSDPDGSPVWFVVAHHTVWASHETCVEEATLYDRSGRVLALVRQGRSIRWE